MQDERACALPVTEQISSLTIDTNRFPTSHFAGLAYFAVKIPSVKKPTALTLTGVDKSAWVWLNLRLASSRGDAAGGRIPKWPTGADCKSAGLRLHWFESSSYHHFFSITCICSPGRASL